MDARKRGENESAWAPREAVVDVLTGAAAYIRADVQTRASVPMSGRYSDAVPWYAILLLELACYVLASLADRHQVPPRLSPGHRDGAIAATMGSNLHPSMHRRTR